MNEEVLEKMLNANKNLIVEGDVSSGKTTNIFFSIVENIINKRENIFIIDAKEEYINKYYDSLQFNGYNIIIVNLRDLSKSEGWNPLTYPYNLYKNGNTDKAIEYLEKIGKTIFGEKKETIDSFWIDSATDFFTGVALALFEDGKESEINFSSISNMFTSMGKKFATNDYLTTYFESKDKNDVSYICASTTLLAPKDTKGGILATAKQKLRLFAANEKLTQFMSKTTFEFNDFTSKPMAIIFIARDENRYLNVVLSMFIEQLYGRLIDAKSKCRFNFVFDNFDIIDNQNGLQDLLSSCIFRNIRTYIGTRSLDDFWNKYGSYTKKLCDILRIQNDKLIININNNNEEVSKDFKSVIINESNINYPNLANKKIDIFNVEEKAIAIKKNQYASGDFSTPDLNLESFNVDDLLKNIDEKLSQIELEEKLESSNEKEEIKSELSQFKTNN